MRRSALLVFFQLDLPLPLAQETAARLIERLAVLPRAGRLVLETRATGGEVSVLLGCVDFDIAAVRRTLQALIPGATLQSTGEADRGPVSSAVSLTGRPAGPLAAELELVTLGLFAAMHRARSSNALSVVQVVIDVVYRPSAPSLAGWIVEALVGSAHSGSASSSRGARRQEPTLRLRAQIRLAVAGDDPAERRRRGREIESSYRHALPAAARLVVRPLAAAAIDGAPNSLFGAWPVTAAELARLAAWPLGDQQLPGMPAPHPRRLMPSRALERRDRIFADAVGGSRPVGLSITDAMSHLLAIGPTGSGKTTTLTRLALADILAGRGVVVVDPKDAMPGYLAARIPKRRRDDVIWIDPSDPDAIGFNPLDAGDRDPDVVADAVLSVFARTFAGSWGPRTADIFSASLRTLTRAGRGDEAATLADLPRLWSDVKYRRRLLARVAGDLGLESFWAAYDELGPRGQATWIASPMNKLRSVLLRPAAMRVVCARRPRFRLRDVFADRRVLLLSLNEGLIGPQTAELIGGLVVAELWQATEERAREDGAASRPAVVYLDEADRFMTTPAISLADALARSRSLHVGWCLAVQHWEALPTAMRAAIMSNARSKLVWRLESNEDARLFARLAPDLEPEDFRALPRFHLYASLLSGGEPQPWVLARTRGPEPATGSAAAVKRHSQSRWGGGGQPVPTTTTTTTTTTTSAADAPTDDSPTSASASDEPANLHGRALRRPS